ncbi:rRNA 2'-O-methyltransferase fibrillarin [Cucumispora dikerogammari]|nr:rRNA 2'-O-methyltransferase fibrillarin [Cucumispora dikerogammari]
MVTVPQHKRKFNDSRTRSSNNRENRSNNNNKPNNKFSKFSKSSNNKNSKFSKSANTEIIPHPKFPNIFILKAKQDTLLTENLVPGISVYNEKRISQATSTANTSNTKTEYRTWNPYRSKLAACIVSGCDMTFLKPGTKVLYLGAASGTTVSHISDIITNTGTVYAIEFSQRSGRDLVNLAKKRSNIIPIIEDARLPHKYRMLVPIVDCIISDVAQPDQTRIVGLNAQYFLKAKGGVMISIKANCVDSTVNPEVVFGMEVNVMRKEGIKPKEQVGLEPFEKDHCMLIGEYKGL